VGCSRGKVDEIVGADHFALPFDFHNGFPFKDKEGLFEVRMGMGVSLASVFNLPQDHFNPIGPEGPWTEEAAVRSPGVARGSVGQQVMEMDNVLFHI
jgi:hypothetical protein